MKNLFSIFSLCFFSIQITLGQNTNCVPDLNVITPNVISAPGTTYSNGSYTLATVESGIPYSLTLTLLCPSDTVFETPVLYNSLEVNSMDVEQLRVTDVLGLPSGLNWDCDEASYDATSGYCYVSPGDRASICITGNVIPSNIGSYNLTVKVGGSGFINGITSIEFDTDDLNNNNDILDFDNYNMIVVVPTVLGCTEASAFNFNASANSDDGSCEDVINGCINNQDFNYDA